MVDSTAIPVLGNSGDWARLEVSRRSSSAVRKSAVVGSWSLSGSVGRRASARVKISYTRAMSVRKKVNRLLFEKGRTAGRRKW